MNKIAAMLLLAVLLLSTSCSEDNSTNDNEQSGVYFPLRVGNWWKYSLSIDRGPTEITNTISRDTVIDGKTWYILTNDYDASFSLYRHDGKYLQMRVLVSEEPEEYLNCNLYNENSKVGDSIVTTMTTTVGAVKIVSKVTGQGGAKIVNNVQYKNVLILLISAYYKNSPQGEYVLAAQEEDDAAWNIGPIYMAIPGTMTKELKSYKVKL